MYKLTKERRYEVCIHEAAHAVIGALSGEFIFRIAVAPVGATDWVYTTRNGVQHSDAFGFTSGREDVFVPFVLGLIWDDDAEETYRVFEKRKFTPTERLLMRACLCNLLAGPIADLIVQKDDDLHIYESQLRRPNDDVCKAWGLADVLPWRNEYVYANRLVAELLQRSDVWAMVIKLADELERVGDMENFDGFLPSAVEGWPSSPRAKKPVVIGQLTMPFP